MARMSSPFRPLARLTRLAALIVWAAQLGLFGVSAADARAEARAAPHVEASGSPLHDAHTPDVCVACAAHALLGLSHSHVVRAPVPVISVARATRVPTAERRSSYAAPVAAARPRAPPA